MDLKVLPFQILVLISFVELARSAVGCNFPAVFNFGDSNSDTGGLAAAFGQHLLPPPYGRTFFHASTGRFSDGRTIIDFMAESLGLPYLSPFLDPIASNFSHGANFATGGSTIFFVNGLSPFSLDIQLAQFSHLLTRSKIVRKQGLLEKVVPDEGYFSRALYTFDIGQNDITAAFARNLTLEEKVYNLGGRSFWIHNTGPLGCLTYFIDNLLPHTETRLDQHGCFIPYNDAACPVFQSQTKGDDLATQGGPSSRCDHLRRYLLRQVFSHCPSNQTRLSRAGIHLFGSIGMEFT